MEVADASGRRRSTSAASNAVEVVGVEEGDIGLVVKRLQKKAKDMLRDISRVKSGSSLEIFVKISLFALLTSRLEKKGKLGFDFCFKRLRQNRRI